ncbi:thiamine pyrophosphate-dependent dehydrogenase E1 component subunit alpha [Staphylococcus hominis]|jgi:TPP-dependent pyruvate/acetoin dehydrogenase alpha subunit|uniref:thiamine pyrophosphate-dependent dehydrogenase E1 component subunit alpha n=1 Tax=Staphylococcus TaxID=1279 RepID=UPI0001EF550A|nr:MULTISPECIES: thiamine pyrophosphate-dependent dehydrogenase E1 component subunit alpha [Staphylococcus]OFK81636.1 ABC transporter substrate-binding protein [Staphylococcus sp. HMSC057A02]OFM66065.1 ABC transporter substrate-binding protein [Staphylococcus sp. HMSC068D07]OFN15290.1 ABC transporter substrate-binding protein [Staphylococcus sp. HMSC058D09]OFR09969.1 ABC transporter substrate-binding protein [Staphylococcus sp. HMSC078E07]EFS20388.1 TPP-dependent acetoin dehydrogenase complex,
MKMEKEQARWIYKTMNEIRFFEEKVHKIFSDGQIPGFVHLYVGEEAVATGVMSQLTDDDYITSTHRGHGHAIAKGCDLNGMMAEIMGKRDGLGHGKGGSMHVAEIDKGMLGANGIVGGGFGLAIGASISIINQGKDNVAVCFFGDGAANEGTFHEGLNFASILNLPVIFVCENNQFAEGTTHDYASASETIAERASAYNMPGVRVDGMDVLEVYKATQEAVDRAKKGEGPTLIECDTYRKYGHFEGDEQKVKSPDDRNADKNATVEFRKQAIEEGWLTEEEADDIENTAEQAVEDAVKFADESELPDEDSLYKDVFA